MQYLLVCVGYSPLSVENHITILNLDL